MLLGFAGVGSMQAGAAIVSRIGLVLLLTGIVIRWSAIQTLGKYFTGTVLIVQDHKLIRRGIYKYVRHPAYAGALLAHLGLGLAFANWWSLILSVIPYLVAAIYRMHVEEQALRTTFGSEYVEYANHTNRLIPRVY